jgi:hypothetical protein
MRFYHVKDSTLLLVSASEGEHTSRNRAGIGLTAPSRLIAILLVVFKMTAREAREVLAGIGKDVFEAGTTPHAEPSSSERPLKGY